jgi:GTP-binding protein
MRFVDEAIVEVFAGNGGNGCVAMRREKFIPLGGPAGGDGGNGGDVVLVADEGLGTLMDLQYRRHVRADHGEHGRGRDQYGKAGKTTHVRVPVGTQVYDHDTGELLADLSTHQASVIAAKGGRGGFGNKHFATPYDRAPRRAEPGQQGEHRVLRLELKLMADVGILGYPNAGKSTFIATVSRARPKIADYPFTTLVPQLGVVSLGEERSFVLADIPGIIEGAAEGAGLGLRFLKHLERTRVILVLVTVDADPERSPSKDVDVLLAELGKFSDELAQKPRIIAMSKCDLPEVQENLPQFRADMKRQGYDPVYSLSSVSRKGVDELLAALEDLLSSDRAAHDAASRTTDEG